MHQGLLKELGGATLSEEAKQGLARVQADAARLHSEKAAIEKEAKELKAEADQEGKINDRCDLAALFLQIGIVVCSVAILSEWKPFWYIGILLGAAGAVLGATAFMM